jgi:hypothetical protein
VTLQKEVVDHIHALATSTIPQEYLPGMSDNDEITRDCEEKIRAVLRKRRCAESLKRSVRNGEDEICRAVMDMVDSDMNVEDAVARLRSLKADLEHFRRVWAKGHSHGGGGGAGSGSDSGDGAGAGASNTWAGETSSGGETSNGDVSSGDQQENST